MTAYKFIHGVALANYRGIGGDLQRIGPFEQFNFFIGENNSGKSTILHFIANHLRPMVASSKRQFGSRDEDVVLNSLDVRLGASSRDVVLSIGFSIESIVDELCKGNFTNKLNEKAVEIISKILKSISDGETVWLKRKEGASAFSLVDKDVDVSVLKIGLSHDEWYNIWANITNQGGGSLSTWTREVIERIINSVPSNLPEIKFIPAIRQISKKGNAFDDYSGKGLIEELARFQNPGPLERDKLGVFKKINEFLKSVTNNESAAIEITYDREHVLVHVDDKVLPLENLGTGIHEVVMLAAFCTIMENQVICIEEPEIHLHPILQKRFIRYLADKTKNQYFIATHSASLIDFPGAAVFAVDCKNGLTQVEPVFTSSLKLNVIQDLGYRASDLLQANSIIWVEGPSDRIYLKHWIGGVAPELREGIDFSIMFYGGRLLNHLTADDSDNEGDISGFIELCKINRNLAIVIDSDRRSADELLNSTKNRIIDEVERTGIAWVTEGREIENYINSDLMGLALSTIYENSYLKRVKKGVYDSVLEFKRKDGSIFNKVDKIAIAKFVCSQPVDLGVLGLEAKIARLVNMIKKFTSK